MSGPKVVRIITREEMLETCQRLLNRLDKTIEQWETKRKLLAGDLEYDINMIKKRRQQLQSLLDTDQFMELQQAIPLEFEYLTVHLADCNDAAIKHATEQRQVKRQLKENAEILLQQFKEKKITPPAELYKEIKKIKKGQDIANCDAILQKGFLLLQTNTSQTHTSISKQQQMVLDKITDLSQVESFSQWLYNNKPRTQTPALQKLDRYLSEINLLNSDAYHKYIQRIEYIENESNPNRHQLQLDSLLIDIAKDIHQYRQRQSLIDRLELLMTEMTSKNLTLPSIAQMNIMQITDKNLVEIEELIASCEKTLNEQIAAQTTQYRRDVILNGLAKLGYKVNEGMATIWQQDGKLVLHNPVTPGYGIEVGSNNTYERIQFRPVRMTQTEDKRRDIDVETLWCGDFAKLRQWLAQQGSSLLLERSLPIGQAPVKYVATQVDMNSSHIKDKKMM